MIFDHITNKEHYRGLPGVYEALCFLAKWREEGMPAAHVDLDGDRLFANPVSLTTRPAGECRYEAHRRYIDIHYTISGAEGIDVRQVSELTPEGDFDPAKDIGFYSGPPSAACVVRPGEFLVCWPEDAHRVAMMQDTPAPVDKMVVKVRVNAQ